MTVTFDSNTAALVEFKDVCFGYSERRILDEVSFHIPRGKVTALMGASGGGKTTVLRLISGQHKVDSGLATWKGQEIKRLDDKALYAARRQMGMLYQFGALFTDLSVFDNVAFPLREHTPLSEVMIRDIVLMKLQAVGLRGARDLSPSEISGGMARRVALAWTRSPWAQRLASFDNSTIPWASPRCWCPTIWMQPLPSPIK